MAHETTRPIRRRIQRMVLALGAVALVALPGPAAAASHFSLEIHDTFVDDVSTAACGTLVIVTIDADLNVTLVYRDGLLVREIDPSGGGRITRSAPEYGTSSSYPFNTVIIDYGTGAAVGSPMTMSFNGVIGNVPGYIPADAGRIVLSGYVTQVEGVPLPDFEITDFVSFNGRVTEDPDVIQAAGCAALVG